MAYETFLVRHGMDDFSTGNLMQEGVQQAEHASDQLAEKGVGARALILTAELARTKQTADIISAKLGAGILMTMILADIARLPRNQLVKMANFRDVLERAVQSRILSERPFIVVTQAPVIAAVLRLPEDDIDFGGVYEYPSPSQ